MNKKAGKEGVTMKCVLLENIDPIAKEALEEQGLKTVLAPSLNIKSLIREQDVAVLCVRSSTLVTKELIEAISSSLQVIGAFCIGTDSN